MSVCEALGEGEFENFPSLTHIGSETSNNENKYINRCAFPLVGLSLFFLFLSCFLSCRDTKEAKVDKN